jgi:NADH-quinone oxidoreductase subunit G
MPKVIIDGREIEFPAGERLNAIEAARRAGIEIPHYCYHPGLTVVGSCRMCLVETGTRDAATGKITMTPKLVPGCNTLVTDNMVVVTQGQKVKQAEAMVEEDLLLRHPIDCPICDKAGECMLQDYYFRYGQSSRRADLQPFTSRRRDLGDITLFVDRCILCSRCVRFCNEISGTSELMVVRRGSREEIDVVPGHPLHNNLSGNVVDLCPVGALCDKDFLYKQRVWFLRQHKGICTGCATGCSIMIEENQDHIYRLKPRVNMEVNKWWMCNEGRYGYHHVHAQCRLVGPRRREKGQTALLDWTTLAGELKERLTACGAGVPPAQRGSRESKSAGGTPAPQARRLAGVLSPYLSVEEAYLLATLLRSLDPEAFLALGPVPTVGEDQRFKGGFVVSSDKSPNRRGVEAIVGHFMHRIPTFEDFLGELDRNDFGGAWVSGGYKGPWIDEPTAERFARVPLVIVQDLFPSPLSERAAYELPSAAWAERDGSYVNRWDRLQTSLWAVRPPWGVRPEGQLYWDLLGRPGLFDHRAVLDDLSREVLYFSAATVPVPDVGIDLKVNLLAGQVEEAGHREATA